MANEEYIFKLAEFEQEYDVNKYSFDEHLDKIKAPIMLHQGAKDEAVPISWSDSLAEKLEELEIDITYYSYSQADHNLQPNWNQVVQRDLSFFKQNL